MLLIDLSRRIGGRLVGNGDTQVTGCAPIQTAGPTDLAFVANRRYLRHLSTTRAGAVLVGEDVSCPADLPHIVCADPYFAFRNALIALVGFRQHPDAGEFVALEPRQTTGPLIAIHPMAAVHATASVHPFVTVSRGAAIGARTVLYPGVFIGPDAVIGADCVLFPNVTVYDGCRLGDRVTLHAGTVIGQDGFGYATHAGAHHKIPQSGTVVVEDDVEMGAGCAVERAAIGETRIGAGTKFADLISIGHGTTIGRHCLLVSLVGISGSVEIGNYVVLGGQVGVTGHLRIGDGVQAAGRSAIATDIEPGRKVGGAPAIDLDQSKRNLLAARDLYGLAKRVRQLERRIERAGLAGADGTIDDAGEPGGDAPTGSAGSAARD